MSRDTLIIAEVLENLLVTLIKKGVLTKQEARMLIRSKKKISFILDKKRENELQ